MADILTYNWITNSKAMPANKSIKQIMVGEQPVAFMGRFNSNGEEPVTLSYVQYAALSFDKAGVYDIEVPKTLEYLLYSMVGGGRGGQQGNGGNNTAGKGGSAGNIKTGVISTSKNFSLSEDKFLIRVEVGAGGSGGNTNNPESGGRSLLRDRTKDPTQYRVMVEGGTTLASTQGPGAYSIGLTDDVVRVIQKVKPIATGSGGAPTPIFINQLGMPMYQPTAPGSGNGNKGTKGKYGAGGLGGNGGFFNNYTGGGDGADGLVQLFFWGYHPYMLPS